MSRIPDWFWSFISSALSVITIFTTYHIFFLDQPRREITVNLEPPIPLISLKESVNQELRIFYKERPLESSNIYTLNSQIVNSGNEPIEEEDYSKPIKFIFNQNDKLISVSSKFEPDNITVRLIKISDNEAELDELLLNQGDKIYSTFLVQSKNHTLITKNLNITARIKGINQIKKIVEEPRNKTKSSKVTWFWFLLFCGTIIAVFIGEFIKRVILSRMVDTFKDFVYLLFTGLVEALISSFFENNDQ